MRSMIDLDRLQTMSDDQLAATAEKLFEDMMERSGRAPAELVDIIALVPLLASRLRTVAEYVEIPRLI